MVGVGVVVDVVEFEDVADSWDVVDGSVDIDVDADIAAGCVGLSVIDFDVELLVVGTTVVEE